MKPLQSDRCIIRHRLSYPIDHTLTPFSPQNTNHVINNIKNSPATGPDSISNFQFKHLGPQGIQVLTNISNCTYAHCLMLNIWKQGRIITILKPNKDPTTPSSYRPITLLCTIQNHRTPYTEHNPPRCPPCTHATRVSTITFHKRLTN